ncbi:vesicle transport through interaction with t-SNAREs 1 [Clonorchis sinensis]|uniref:Vesicle transport through interaction with t-SNAREs 1 n=1 Tax=Clonorchis sinensis TaxID=79923 RepID=G7YLM7_CLOSI|nr:vesicle transport through interaction with t-SNAREs 1 [Clonorchis sinensis]
MLLLCFVKSPRYAARTMSDVSKRQFEGDEESLREEVLYDSDMRTRLLDNTERIARSTNRLEDGLGVALQTEEVGGHILNDLEDQREKLQRSRHRLRQADADLTKSSRILSEMTRRIIQNRVILVGTIFLMIVIFLVAIYLVTKRGPSSTAPNSLSLPLSGVPVKNPDVLRIEAVDAAKDNAGSNVPPEPSGKA